MAEESLDVDFNFPEVGPQKEIKQYFKTDHDEEPHFELSPHEKNESPEESARVLEPEHPLLAKFQKALKDHLEKQIEHLNNEIFEYETAAKKKCSEKDQLGVDAYETQQIVAKQQIDLDNYMKELCNITAVRGATEQRLQSACEEHKLQQMELFETEKKEIELRKEMDSVNLLVQQMTSWENDIESELKVNQRIFEKTKKDKSKLAEEKRKQDMLVYKLMNEVWELEAELETMLMQLRVKEEEREKLAETVAISNTDIEAAETEHRCLLHGWHSVIVAIASRDKHFNQVNQELTHQTEKLRAILSEIEQVKKLCQREMNQNENLIMFKHRIEADINNCKHQLDIEENKRDNLERNMMKTQAIIDQTENDFNRVANGNRVKTVEMNHLIRDFEKITREKVATETTILSNLQDQITTDKASRYLSKLLYDIKIKNRSMEIALGNTENRNAMLIMDIECQRGANEESARALEDLKKQQAIVDKEISNYIDEINKCYSSANKKEREIEILNRKLEKLKASGEVVKSPHELKISALEQHIEHVQEKNKDLQKFWMREQGHVVCLSEQRQEQIHDSNLLRKQTMILEQRNLKINDELEIHRKQEEKMMRNINKLQNQLVYYTESLNKKKGSKHFLDESNMLLQSEFLSKLKSEELEIAKKETEIVDINNDIQELSNDLLEKNREALEWEKKYKMVMETKENISVEKGEGGEVGTMRSEIHRMNVRYSQLKKAQDKLISDLEYCVSRRDAIVTNAEAREKRLTGIQSQVIFNRKLDDMRNKVKSVRVEIEDVQRLIADVENETKLSHAQVDNTNDDIAAAKIDYINTERDIEEVKTEKQMKLELLLMQQRKYKMYTELAKGRKPFMPYKTSSRLQMEYTYQSDLNSKLTHIIDELMNDFPTLYHIFHRISNTLKLSMISI